MTNSDRSIVAVDERSSGRRLAGEPGWEPEARAANAGETVLSANPGRRSAGRRRRSRGQSLVEFAVIFPVFMLILSGMLDFGFALYSRMSVINAAREGARAASVVIPTGTPASHDPAMTNNAKSSAQAALANAGLSATSISVSCVPPSGGPACTMANSVAGDSVLVIVHYSYKSFFPLLFGSSFDLSSSVQMVMEQ